MLTYLAAHWMLASGVTLTVAGLGAAAWFLKSPKIALAAIALAVAGFMYQGAVTHGIELQLQKEMAAKVATLNNRITAVNQTNEAHAASGLAAAEEINRLEEIARETPANTNDCGDVGFRNRVHNIR